VRTSFHVLSPFLIVALIIVSCARNQNQAQKSEAAKGPVLVETFTAVTEHTISLPGKPEPRGGVDFSGTTNFSSLAFTPGAVDFAGRSVEFHGKEADFLASNYSGEVNVPSRAGPRKVTVRGVLTARGFVFPRPMVGNSTADDLQLGDGFSSKRLEFPPSQKLIVKAVGLNWQSPVVPELNGSTVALEVEKTIPEVDAATGRLQIRMNGKIFATPPPPGCAFIPVWGLMQWGAALLGLSGLLLLEAVFLLRRGGLAANPQLERGRAYPARLPGLHILVQPGSLRA